MNVEYDPKTTARQMMANLVAEYPEDEIIYATISSGSFTGAQMQQEILKGTEIGRKYGSDVLRVARDLLARQAQRKGNK